MKPTNLPLLIGNVTEKQNAAIEKVIKADSLSFQEILLCLGSCFRLKVWFKEPVTLQTIWRKIKLSETSWQRINTRTSDVHIFPGLFMHGSSLCYKFTKSGRHGYYFPDLKLIEKYEIVIENQNKFESYEAFKKKFDPMFITEDQIKKFWNSKSSQHGGQYKPSDFHKIGPKGKRCLKLFLSAFEGVNNAPNIHYMDGTDTKVLTMRSSATGCNGRDITISHSANQSIVFYSSE